MTIETATSVLGLLKLTAAYWAIRLFFMAVVRDVERYGRDVR